MYIKVDKRTAMALHANKIKIYFMGKRSNRWTTADATGHPDKIFRPERTFAIKLEMS